MISTGLKDSNGDVIYVGNTVAVPDPEVNDLWNHSFTATVQNRKSPNLVTVIDQAGDAWDVETCRITILWR